MSGELPRSEDNHLQKLPPYTYVPGLTPHPVSDPRGHSFGSPPLTPHDSLAAGSALFDAGYYWEAHEVWEGAWQAAGRAGPHADFLKGLIKLAACGVKCLEQNGAGAARHARRAAELFQAAAQGGRERLPEANLNAAQLRGRALQLAEAAPQASPLDRQAAMTGGSPVLGPLPRGD